MASQLLGQVDQLHYMIFWTRIKAYNMIFKNIVIFFKTLGWGVTLFLHNKHISILKYQNANDIILTGFLSFSRSILLYMKGQMKNG